MPFFSANTVSAALSWWHSLSLTNSLLVGALVVASATFLVILLVDWIKGPPTVRVLEGVRVVSAAKLARKTRHPDKAKRQRQLMFGQVPWPAELEDKHALMVGTTGAGKSTLIRQIIRGLRARSQRAIIIDLNGEFAAEFCTPDDKVFNPFDPISVKWNPLNEIEKPEDIDLVLKAAIPSGSTADEETWRSYSRQYLSALMFRLQEAGELRLDRLRYYVMDAGDKEVAAFLQAGSRPYRIQANSMASTMKTVAQNCVQSLERASDAADFSVRQWVRRGKGFIFITPREQHKDALMTLINAFMNLAIAESLSAPPGKRYRPIAVIVDELSSFELDDLEGVLAKGRKFGLVAFAGFQAFSQLREKYGADGAATLLACFRTKVVFNPGDAETAQRMAEEIGRQTLERRETSHTQSTGGSSSTTVSWRREEGFAVSPELLLSLPNLHAYLKLGGDFAVAKIVIPRKSSKP